MIKINAVEHEQAAAQPKQSQSGIAKFIDKNI